MVLIHLPAGERLLVPFRGGKAQRLHSIPDSVPLHKEEYHLIDCTYTFRPGSYDSIACRANR